MFLELCEEESVIDLSMQSSNNGTLLSARISEVNVRMRVNGRQSTTVANPVKIGNQTFFSIRKPPRGFPIKSPIYVEALK